jgi:ribosomal-protein-alanine N-acetyltransferase
VKSAGDILSDYSGGIFAGPGAERFAELIRRNQKGTVRLAEPVTYDGGELAELFVENREQFGILDPADLQINYVFKSQPEQKRDDAREQIVIGEMGESDLDSIMRIEAESFSDAWHRASFEQDIDSRWVITLAARAGDRCVGYANCVSVDDYGYLSNIAVDKEFRSQGIGRKLLDELCNRLRAGGRARLLLDVRPSNQNAVVFYEKYGFAILVRRQNFYTKPLEDSYTMILEFGN